MPNPVRLRRLSVLISFCLLRVSALTAQADDPSWNSLKQLTHRATFVFVDTQRNCFAGWLHQVSDSAVLLELGDGEKVTVNRPDLLRVNYGTFATGVLYSARSSWFDVTVLGSPKWQTFHPMVAVVEKSGKEYEGRLVSASENEVTLQIANKRVSVERSKVKSISSVIQKPLSSSAQYADNELSFMRIFDPELWPIIFGTQGSLRVKIFDAEAPEDDSPIVCKNDPYHLNQPGLDLTRH